MLADLLPLRLYWAGARGLARKADREVRLTAPPHLPGLQIEAIDYVPGELAIVMPKREGWRDMTAAEIAAAAALLDELTQGASDAPT